MPATAGASPAEDPDYVDQIDNGQAAVVSPNGNVRTVAVADLPAGAKEGTYLSGGRVVGAPPDDAAPIRARLAAGDTGGVISLADQPPATAAPGAADIESDSGGPVLGGADVPGASPAAAASAPGAPGAPGAADAFIDNTIAAPAVGAPAAGPATPPIPKLGPGGLPASSEDLQQRIQQGVEGEKKALEGVQDAQKEGSEDVQKAIQDREELRRQQAADLAAEQLYVRERRQKLNDEDAANLKKARDEVIPDFWQSREGDLAGAAITVALSGAAGALLGSTHNQALDAITHNIDAYSQRQADRINNLYKYAEAKGQLDDKMRSQYAGQLTDLMQQHAYMLQAASDRIQEVSDQSKGRVDQAQTAYLSSQLNTKATDLLAKAREIDEKNYDSQTKREVADADMIRANAAMAKVHKGKGGGGGAGGTDWMTAASSAAQQPGATELSVAKAARDAGFKGKDTTLKGFAATEIANVGKQTEGVEKQMKDFETQLNGSGGKLGPAGQLGRIQAMKGVVADAVASGDPDRIKAAMTQIKEEAGGMLSGGKTTQFTGKMLDEAQSISDKLKEHWSKLKGNPTEGAHFVSAITKLLGNVEQEKLAEVHEIRQKAVDQTLGPGGTANSPAAKRHVLARFSGITGGIKDANGKPVYQEGGAAASAPAGHVEGATSKTASGIPIVFRGGKWVRQ